MFLFIKKCISAWLSLGEHNRNTYEGSEQVIQASKVISHPNWNMQTLENDIALIKLKNPAKYNKYVYPICLPEDHVPVGYKCFITGKWLLNPNKPVLFLYFNVFLFR